MLGGFVAPLILGVQAHHSSPTVLVCAGHDPTGRAGIDADREAVVAGGGNPWPVVTTDTQQAGGRVLEVTPRAEADWEPLAMDAIRGGTAAVKFGLLARAQAVSAAARLARAQLSVAPSSWVVVDPVLAASGGERFLDQEGVRALLEELIPAGVVLTPNLPELAELTGSEPRELDADVAAQVAAAGRLIERGARAVCVKGGHGRLAAAGGEPQVVDLLVCPAHGPERRPRVARAARPRVPGPGIRGSGCRFASFLAGCAARGEPLDRAFASAGEWVARAIAAAP